MRPTTTTRVPAQIDKLIELFEADTPLADVRICDGAPLQQPDEEDLIVIAPSTPEASGVEVDYLEQPGLGASYVEQATIICVVSCWNGDDNLAERRQRVQTIVGRVQAILAEQQVVDGVWDAVGFDGVGEWHLVRGEDGTTAAFGFAISCRSVI